MSKHNAAISTAQNVLPLRPPALNERAMLASLNIRQWSARKHDKRITREVADREHAAADSGRYNKRLLPKNALAAVQAAASALRAEHYKRTLPWSDEGARILSTTGYFDYTQALTALRADFDRATEAFIDAYDDLRDEAQRTLGNLFNVEDYPLRSDIASKFGVETHMLPLPDQNDFRAKLPEDQAADIRADIERQVKESLRQGQLDIFKRATDVLTHASTKLSEYKPATRTSKAEGIFRDTLITNIRELAALIPSLNVTNDPQISELCADLTALASFEPDILRVSDTQRTSAKDKADAILAKIDGVLA